MHTFTSPAAFRHFATFRLCIVALLLSLITAGSALADDWVVLRLRGQVFTHDGAQWVPLKRGSVVSDDRVIRTAKDGKVTFARGKEQIGLEPNTQIQIIDAQGTLKTRVIQKFGVVSIEAERRNVQHFSVQTPFMAAVVKGTRFVVTATEQGASVAVSRGVVQVTDRLHDVTTDITRGQSASVDTDEDSVLTVEGPGAKHAFVLGDGTVVAPEDFAAGKHANAQGRKAGQGEGAGNGSSGTPAVNNGNGVSVNVTKGGGSLNAGIGVGHGNGNGNGNGGANGGGHGNSGGQGNSGGNGGGHGNSGNGGGNGNSGGSDGGNGNHGGGHGNPHRGVSLDVTAGQDGVSVDLGIGNGGLRLGLGL